MQIWGIEVFVIFGEKRVKIKIDLKEQKVFILTYWKVILFFESFLSLVY